MDNVPVGVYRYTSAISLGIKSQADGSLHGAENMRKQFEAVRARFPGQEWKVRIMETGWPTRGTLPTCHGTQTKHPPRGTQTHNPFPFSRASQDLFMTPLSPLPSLAGWMGAGSRNFAGHDSSLDMGAKYYFGFVGWACQQDFDSYFYEYFDKRWCVDMHVHRGVFARILGKRSGVTLPPFDFAGRS